VGAIDIDVVDVVVDVDTAADAAAPTTAIGANATAMTTSDRGLTSQRGYRWRPR
jgi:hypothetical protein